MHNENLNTVNPYLTFAGNTREAMSFYKEALGGELDIMTFDGAPMEVHENYRNFVMHATLVSEGVIIMASDNRADENGNPLPVKAGEKVHISIAAKNVEDGEKFFNNLSAGGTITMPFQETFWEAKFGMLTDKFGINWMINCQLKK